MFFLISIDTHMHTYTVYSIASYIYIAFISTTYTRVGVPCWAQAHLKDVDRELKCLACSSTVVNDLASADTYDESHNID